MRLRVTWEEIAEEPRMPCRYLWCHNQAMWWYVAWADEHWPDWDPWPWIKEKLCST